MFLYRFLRIIIKKTEAASNKRVFPKNKVTGESQATVKPIFHWKLGLRWLPNANEINTKNMKCTWPTPEFCVGTNATYLPLACVWISRLVKRKFRGLRWLQDTNMLVSPTPNSGVGGIAQRQTPMPGILRSSGI